MSLSEAAPLEASQSRNERFWIRAPPAQMRRTSRSQQNENALVYLQPPIPPFRRFHVVFGYTTKDELSEWVIEIEVYWLFISRLRYLQHEASLQLLPSLQFSATCARTQGSEVDSLMITLRCKNVSLQVSLLPA